MGARPRLDALTSLRFAAAALVVCGHLAPLHHAPELPGWLLRAITDGLEGVSFFFVLSGFVLGYSYHARLAQPTRAGLAGYYAARVARVWPVHLLVLGVVVLVPIGTAAGPGPLAANALLVQAWVPDWGYSAAYNAVTWSLSVEAFFYLAFPLLPWLAARRSLGPGRAAALAALAWAGPAVLVALHCRNPGPRTAYLAVVFPPARFGEFAAGALLGLAFARTPNPTPIGTRATVGWTALELLAVLAVVGCTAVAHRVPPVFRTSGFFTPAYALVVAVFARQRGAVSWLLARRVPVFLGDISFALFLVHGPVIVYLARWPAAAGLPPLGLAGLAFGLALAVAALVHRGFEVPLRAGLRRSVPGGGITNWWNRNIRRSGDHFQPHRK